MKPLIGITADFEESGEFRSRLKSEGRYILREGYVRAVADAGGEPLVLPYAGDPKTIVNRIDGLLISGGNFDIPPELSGIRNPKDARAIRWNRTRFELDLFKRALRRDMPVLGICGGMQVIAVALGGSLIGDIAAEVPGALEHEQKTPRDKPGHKATIAPKSLLHRIVKTSTIGVNSSHHQGVADSGKAATCARATDGVIEAIELDGRKFVLGVQWHPEILYKKYAPHRAIFKVFIKAASRIK